MNENGTRIIELGATAWREIINDNFVKLASIEQLNEKVLPSGGTKGQALVKKSAIDNEVEWKTIEGGSGGSTTETLETVTGSQIKSDNGTLQETTLTANTTFTYVIDEGFSITYRLNTATFTPNFGSIKKCNFPDNFEQNKKHIIVFTKISGNVEAYYVGILE